MADSPKLEPPARGDRRLRPVPALGQAGLGLRQVEIREGLHRLGQRLPVGPHQLRQLSQQAIDLRVGLPLHPADEVVHLHHRQGLQKEGLPAARLILDHPWQQVLVAGQDRDDVSVVAQGDDRLRDDPRQPRRPEESLQYLPRLLAMLPRPGAQAGQRRAGGIRHRAVRSQALPETGRHLRRRPEVMRDLAQDGQGVRRLPEQAADLHAGLHRIGNGQEVPRFQPRPRDGGPGQGRSDIPAPLQAGERPSAKQRPALPGLGESAEHLRRLAGRPEGSRPLSTQLRGGLAGQHVEDGGKLQHPKRLRVHTRPRAAAPRRKKQGTRVRVPCRDYLHRARGMVYPAGGSFCPSVMPHVPASISRTSSLTALPSARPATRGLRTAITLPISLGDTACASPIAAPTSLRSSSPVSGVGR